MDLIKQVHKMFMKGVKPAKELVGKPSRGAAGKKITISINKELMPWK
jgi:hypothetical protein